ncbi:hypothetical protein AC477_05530 [miscellaneous Crenarchaeota group-1 archaeon SG8-32-1]|uniref:Uncharacterized protein n=1 Tax=miscellaneous Crenarchaeota group-1 archaeon SG8-32-1 TaxID=1685124 RepID=A0A0M0BMU4_9ARCH|nr:MAG: hypothetical protein AC477_05530 [miscellaneous Crenarchaeota group-1 archaeon SG8-32-1]
MSASKTRGKILMVLWAAERPLTLEGIAEKIGLISSSTMGYLLGLIKAKYVSVPEKHQYKITSLGKKAIGMPILNKDLAINILKSVSLDNAFQFYFALDQYTGVHANSLKDFVDKIQTVDLKSIEFHAPRKDFELWINSLGDVELAKRLEIIRMKKLTGKNLRTQIHQAVSSRLEELTKLSM